MKDFEHEPDMPKFIPDDRPHKKPCYCNPFYPMPPVPSVVGGNGEMNLYESMNVLNERVNMCIATYNEVMDKCYKALRDLVKAGEENGAYYSPDCVITEEGYDADSNSMYKIVRKRVVDKHGEPIRIKMHLAYGNTTNSKIEQNIFDASKVEYADKIFIAQPKAENGWYGKVIFNGAPLPSADSTALYTVGFTRRGTMRVYSNATDINTIINDGVENAMGCSGVLIQNGEVCAESWYNTIPDYNVKTSRICMGQNTDTGEVIWLATGRYAEEGHEGMTSLKCAEILRAYGCSIAVELCEGKNSGGLDKGGMLYKPENNEAQGAYAFWYISRKNFYKNDYERELALLIQNYASNMWQTFLNTEKIKNLYKDLQDEIVAREEADTLLQSNIDAEATARNEADLALGVRIDNEETAREEADEVLQSNIDSEAETRKHADEVLQDNIDDEARIRKEKDNALDLRIDGEAEARQQADAQLSTRLENEVAARTAEDTRITTALENEVTARTNGDSAINSRIDDVVSALQTWVNSIVANQNAINQQVNTTLAGLRTDVDKNATDISGLNRLIDVINGNMNDLFDRIASNEQAIRDVTGTANLALDLARGIISGSEAIPYLKTSGGTVNGNVTVQGTITATEVTANNVRRTEAVNSGSDCTNKTYVDNKDTQTLQTAMNALSGEITNRQNADTALGGRIDDIVSGTTPLPYAKTNDTVLTGDTEVDYLTGTTIYAPDISAERIRGANTGAETLSISDVITPVNDLDAVNKKYVDENVNFIKDNIAPLHGTTWTETNGKTYEGYCFGNCMIIHCTSSGGFDNSMFHIPEEFTARMMRLRWNTPTLAIVMPMQLMNNSSPQFPTCQVQTIGNNREVTPSYGNITLEYLAIIVV